MNLATPDLIPGAAATAGLFGGNVLATHGALRKSAYDDAIEDLGVTTLRFPGGSLTEFLFDIRNPDAARAYDPRIDENVDMMSLTEFMTHADSIGNPVTIVVPTRSQLGNRVDANGDRLPMIDEAALRSFVQDVATGVFGDAEVRSFEVGNEYWGSGKMNAAEYGRLAAEMSVIIEEALGRVNEASIDIVVQKGNNYDHSELGQFYSDVPGKMAVADINAKYGLDLGEDALQADGRVDWTFVNNEIVRANFEDGAAAAAIDGVVAHVYSRGSDTPNSRSFDLDNINATWRAENPDLDIYVTEWNLKSTANLEREADYGLFQAHEMLNMVEEFVLSDVTEANVWPLIQNTSNPLATGREFEEATVSGEMFAMMAETLPGKVLLDLTPREDARTEMTVNNVAVHGFAGENELALYVVNTDRDGAVMTDVDISGLVQSFGSVDITRLGVAPREAPGSSRSEAKVEDLPPGEVFEGRTVVADLLPGEILQVVMSEVEPTEAFQPVWKIANDPNFADLTDFPMLRDDMPLDDGEDEDLSQQEDDGGDLSFALALLPLLALFGLAGS